MERKRTIRRVGFVVLVTNVLLVTGKTDVQWATGSLALRSEAVNSLADTVYNTIILDGLYLATKPPDWEHPHDRERIKSSIPPFVAVGIFAADEAILWQSTSSILMGTCGGDTGTLSIVVLVVAVIAKYALYCYCYSVDCRQNSSALTAAGVDSRSDILTAGATLIGVVGGQFDYPILDPLAVVVISVSIAHTSYETVRDNVSYLVEAALSEYLRAFVVQATLSHPDVYGAHNVVVRYVGPEIGVSLHIEVEGDTTTAEAYDTEMRVVQMIRSIGGVDDVLVHIDLKEFGEWKEDGETEHYTMFSPDGGDDR